MKKTIMMIGEIYYIEDFNIWILRKQLKKENKNREIYHKVQTMEHDLLPELYKFTGSVRSEHRIYCDLDPEEIIEKEHTRIKTQKNYN